MTLRNPKHRVLPIVSRFLIGSVAVSYQEDSDQSNFDPRGYRITKSPDPPNGLGFRVLGLGFKGLGFWV